MSVSEASASKLSAQEKRALLARLLEERATARSQRHPLSFAQRRLWFLDRLEPGTDAYNVATTWRLQRPLDLVAFVASLRELTCRHAALRTTIQVVGDEPFQLVADTGEPSLVIVDLQGLPAEKREKERIRWTRAVAGIPFELSRGPLLRVTLLRLEEEESDAVLVMHHIVSDAWSMRILTRELTLLYRASVRGKPSPLPAPTLQYVDFVRWQRRWLQGEVPESQLAYWRRQLADAPVLEMPTDRPRQAAGSRGASRFFSFPYDVRARFPTLAGTTPFLILLAALQVLLHRHTGQEDLCVGTPVASRSRKELEDLVGFFVNTLVLRVRVDRSLSFEAFLDRVRETALEAYAHQDLPFEKLVEELNPRRDVSRSVLFQVAFALQNVPQAHARSAAGARRPGDGDPGLRERVKFELTFELSEGPLGIDGVLEYNRDLFDGSTMQRFLEHYGNLLEGVARMPGEPIGSIPLISWSERHQLLVEWNAGMGAVAEQELRCLHRRFEEQADRVPDAAALATESGQLTYRELDERANQLARHLVSHGVRPGDRVALCLERSAGVVVAILAVLKTGAAYVPLDPAYPAERLAFVLADSGASLLVAEGDPAALPAASVPVVRLDADGAEIGRRGRGRLGVAAHPELPAYVIYTSGSTGRPKGVIVSHANVDRLFTATAAWFGLGPDDVWSLFHSYAFDFSVWELWGPLLHGGRLVVVPYWASRSPADFYRLLRDERVTVLNQTPSAFHQLLWEEEAALGSATPDLALRWVIFGGEALDPASLAPWFARHGDERPRLVNMYGITETTVHATLRPLTSADLGGGSLLGRPLPDLSLHVLDGALRQQPIGIAGEIHVGGAGLSQGYLGRPDLTAERFVPNPFAGEPGGRLYRSGDLARRRPDGDLEYLGRIDLQVKIRGFRIELGEIEAALASHPGVRAAVVLAREDGHDGERRLAAYVVPSAGQALETGPLREHLRARLPDPMLPAAFVFLDALPLTGNGKVDRRALPVPGAATAEPRSAAAPRTPTEEVLAGIWERVLRIETVGSEDSFFDLGGHSLLATQVVSRVREAFGVELPLRLLFESPTLMALARAIETARTAGLELPPLVRVPHDGDLPLSFAQQRVWLMDQLAPGNPFYNLSGALRMSGALDVAALAWAFGEVVRRHETLRTGLVSLDGRPVQRIAPALDFGIPLVDLRALASGARRTTLRRLAAQLTRFSFDLSQPPLLRITLLRLDEREHALVFAMHHIVSDGWSMGVAVSEVVRLYAARVEGRPSPLPELPIQYADFAVWQRGWLQGEALESQLAYWRQRISGAPVVEMPADRPRPPVQTFRGAIRHSFLAADLAASLSSLAREQTVSLFMVLLAGFYVLISRYCGLEDLVVGTPIAGRTRVETEGLIGFFVNTLVLRTDLGGDPTRSDVLSRVRETALGAYAHQDLPFEYLVEKLQPHRDLSRNPLFQLMLNLQNAPAERVSAGDLSLSWLDLPRSTALFDLQLNLTQTGQGIGVVWEYATDLFDGATVERMARQLGTLLTGLAASSETRLSELPLLTAPEREQLLVEWSGETAEWPADDLLHELVAAQARRTPAAVALVHGSRRWSYRDLVAMASGLAGRLQGLGVGPEIPVGIFLPRTPEMLAAMLAVLQAGGAYVPLDPAYPRERLEAILDSAGVLVVMTEPDLAGRLPETAARLLFVAEQGGAPPCPGEVPVTSGCLAYVIYTSGSTGRPKGVAIEHRSATTLMHWARGDFSPPELAGVLASTSICFDLSVFELFVPLCWGGTVILADNALELPELPGKDGVTLVNTVPSAMAELVRQRALPASVRTVNLAGEPLRGALARQIHELGTVRRLLNLYGPSEDTTYSTLAAVGAVGEPTIGRPLPNTRAFVVDAGLRSVPAGVPGELLLGGCGLSRGYLGRPELTAERYVPDPFSGEAGERLYRTGDLVRWTRSGELEYLGRRDHQVKVRGFRIELQEIEAVLTAHPAVREAAVVAREASAAGAEARDLRLTAYVVPRAPAAGALPGELREHLRSKLPDYMVPGDWVEMESLPLSPNGKVDRKALPNVDRSEPSAAAYEPPASGLEQTIAEVWREVLGIERVGRHDNFFDLGGHSLLMARVRSELSKQLDRPLGMVELFSHPRVVSLALHLSRGDDVEVVQAQVESQAARAKQGKARLEQLRQGRRSAHV